MHLSDTIRSSGPTDKNPVGAAPALFGSGPHANPVSAYHSMQRVRRIEGSWTSILGELDGAWRRIAGASLRKGLQVPGSGNCRFGRQRELPFTGTCVYIPGFLHLVLLCVQPASSSKGMLHLPHLISRHQDRRRSMTIAFLGSPSAATRCWLV